MMNEILAAWQWNGSVSEPVPYGEGHINQTYAIMVTSAQGAKRYILQKINTDTFKDPDGLMENICGVTDFLREKAKQCGNDPARATLHVVLTKAGKPYFNTSLPTTRQIPCMRRFLTSMIHQSASLTFSAL